MLFPTTFVSLDLIKPTLLVSPSEEVNERSCVIMTCHAEGTLPITYAWYRGKVLLQQSLSSEVYQVVDVDRSNGSELYHCRASNDAGWKESTQKKIIVRCRLFVLYFVSSLSSFFLPFFAEM